MKQIEELRVPWEGMGMMANTERYIAALTIENLMGEVEAWKRSVLNNERDIAELVRTTHRLTHERDEARRMVCGLDADIMEDQIEYAKHRGWDCFDVMNAQHSDAKTDETSQDKP